MQTTVDTKTKSVYGWEPNQTNTGVLAMALTEEQKAKRRAAYVELKKDPAKMAARREQMRAREAERRATDPEYRQKLRERSREAKRRERAGYEANDEAKAAHLARRREWANEKYANDPEYKARVSELNRRYSRERWERSKVDTELRAQINADGRKFYANGGKERAAAKRAARRARGACYNCSRPALPGTTQCEKHMWTTLCENHSISTREWETLRALAEAQDYKCAYSGVPLTLGKGLSVDHVVPKKSPDYPGDYDFTNMKIVHRRVNTAKNDMPMDEFLRMIENVYNTCIKKEVH